MPIAFGDAGNLATAILRLFPSRSLTTKNRPASKHETLVTDRHTAREGLVTNMYRGKSKNVP